MCLINMHLEFQSRNNERQSINYAVYSECTFVLLKIHVMELSSTLVICSVALPNVNLPAAASPRCLCYISCH